MLERVQMTVPAPFPSATHTVTSFAAYLPNPGHAVGSPLSKWGTEAARGSVVFVGAAV